MSNLVIPKMLLEALPVGYYAASLNDEEHVVFFRCKVTAKNSKRYPPGMKLIQRCHGSGLGMWYSPVILVNNTDEPRVYNRDVLDELLVVVLNYQDAALEFGRLLGRCCRCYAELTDDYSRRYNIGPECVKSWPWVIQAVDDKRELANG